MMTSPENSKATKARRAMLGAAAILAIAAYIRSSGLTAVFRAGLWELGTVRGDRVEIGGQQVVGPRSSAIAAPTAGSVVDVEARASISAILAALRLHGQIAS